VDQSENAGHRVSAAVEELTSPSAVAAVLAKPNGRGELEKYLKLWDSFVASSRDFCPQGPGPVEPEVVTEIRKQLAERAAPK
jgi:hypothetical protein